MNNNIEIKQLINTSKAQSRCLYGGNARQRAAVRRRAQTGAFVNPHYGLYAEQSYWTGLSPAQRYLHVLRALARKHPNWVFTSVSAAAIYQLECPWSLHDGMVYIASDSAINGYASRDVRKIFVAPIHAHIVNGLPVVTLERALVDFALRHKFPQALPIFDSAMRIYQYSQEKVIEICDSLRRDCGPVFRLLYYVDGRSENGGESFCRAVIIELGFIAPLLQQEFIDPKNPRKSYRVDFLWVLPDGRIIVAEFDGMRKYTDPSMTDWKTTRQVVHEEREREDALRQAGVTTIVRIDYQEASLGYPLARKLRDAGVPMQQMAYTMQR